MKIGVVLLKCLFRIDAAIFLIYLIEKWYRLKSEPDYDTIKRNNIISIVSGIILICGIAKGYIF